MPTICKNDFHEKSFNTIRNATIKFTQTNVSDIKTIDTASKSRKTRNLSRTAVNNVSTARCFSTKTRNLSRTAVKNGIAARRFSTSITNSSRAWGRGSFGRSPGITRSVVLMYIYTYMHIYVFARETGHPWYMKLRVRFVLPYPLPSGTWPRQ